MNLLPEVIKRDGFTHTMIIRKGNVAVFDQRHKDSITPRFEVVQIQTHKACQMFGRDYPEREGLPTTEHWGLQGWTYQTLEPAMRHFELMTNGKPYDLYHFLREQRRRARLNGVRR